MINRPLLHGLHGLVVTMLVMLAVTTMPIAHASPGQSIDTGTQSVFANGAMQGEWWTFSTDPAIPDQKQVGGDPPSEPNASIEFENQAVADTNNQGVVVSSATLSDGGFVGIYTTTASGDLDSLIGSSQYLDGGVEHTNVRITLDTPISGTETLTAVPHNDTNDNNRFEHDTDGIDGPYTHDGEPISDSATIRRVTPTPTPTSTLSPTPSPSLSPTPTPTLTPTPTPSPTQESGLACLDVEESELRGQLDDIAAQAMAALPTELQSQAAGERIEVEIGDTNPAYFGAVIDENSTVQSVQVGGLDWPTITAETDCRTIDRITSADNTAGALQRSISRNEITWEGATPLRDAILAYGSKAIQMRYIAISGQVGDILDALEGFVNGVLMR